MHTGAFGATARSNTIATAKGCLSSLREGAVRRKKVDSSLEKQFITAMIVSKPFLASVSTHLDVTLFHSQYLQQIATWCLDYFREYDAAPKRHIESLYHAWVEKEQPEETHTTAIHDFLGELSDNYDTESDLNVSFLLDEISTYLTLKSVGRLKDSLEASIMQGDVQDAVQAVSGFRAIDTAGALGTDPLNDADAWTRTFADPPVPLISFSGDAGRFLNPGMTRDSLIAVQGPEKRGKTFWCIEFAMQALRLRRRVALFEVGDLSESQLMKRIGVRLSGRPMWRTQLKGVKVPTSIELVKNEDGVTTAQVEYDVQDFDDTMDQTSVWRARRRFLRSCGIPPNKPYLMTSTHANSSINVAGISAILSRWRTELNYIPDVVIIDYADILAPEDTKKEARHQVNDTWKALRRLSQERHCLVIAPTQANAASYKTTTQKMHNFSEDKRKLAHVTGMLGLNQTEAEKEQGIMRLNWIVLREAEFHANTCLWVAQCLPLARAMVKAARQ